MNFKKGFLLVGLVLSSKNILNYIPEKKKQQIASEKKKMFIKCSFESRH